MALYEAEIKVVPTGSFFKVQIESGSLNTAQDAIEHIYQPISLRNIRQVRGGSSGSGIQLPSSSWIWLGGIFGGAAAFLYLTPWVLMTIYGGFATWVGEQLTGQSVQEYTDTPNEETKENQHKKAMIVLSAALLFGGVGFVQGTSLHKDLMIKYGGETVQEVRQQNNAK
jgi:hypothetical protein